MRAVLTYGRKGDMTCGEYAEPIPQRGEVRIRVEAAAVCGGDLSGFKKGSPSGAEYDDPHIPGHEFAGVVDQLGEGVEGIALGTRAAIFPTLPCGECEDCRLGHINNCKYRRVVGGAKPSGRVLGGMAQYACVPAASILPIPDTLSYVHGAVVEPLAVALHAIHRAGCLAGKDVAIFGAGSIGLMILELLKAEGTRSISVIDVTEERLALAKAHGAAYTALSQEDAPICIREQNGGSGMDVVFDCVGMGVTIDLAMRLCKSGGTVAMVGLAEPQMQLNYRFAIDHEIRLVGCITYVKEMEECIRLLSDGKVDIDYLLTSVVSIERAKELFEDMVQHPSAHIKTVFLPWA